MSGAGAAAGGGDKKAEEKPSDMYPAPKLGVSSA